MNNNLRCRRRSAAGPVCFPCRGPAPGDLAGDHDEQQSGADQERHGQTDPTLDHERVGSQVLDAVHAEQHDHEQEQHHDRAGVDDDLHGGQEVGVEREEEHRDAEQGRDQAHRRHRRCCGCDRRRALRPGRTARRRRRRRCPSGFTVLRRSCARAGVRAARWRRSSWPVRVDVGVDEPGSVAGSSLASWWLRVLAARSRARPARRPFRRSPRRPPAAVARIQAEVHSSSPSRQSSQGSC